METIFTEELLTTLYNRVNQFAITKWGKEPNTIRIEEGGSISVIYEGYERGDETYEYISLEDLSSDLDVVAQERIERLKREEIEREDRRKQQRILQEQRDKESRKAKYLELKKEFENL